MKFFSCKIVIEFACACLLSLFAGLLTVQAQNRKSVDLQEIKGKLIFRSAIKGKKIEDINRELIEEIQKRKVNFILSLEDEKFLKKSGGSDLLIKTINESLPEKQREKITLYMLYLDNYYRNN